MAEELGHQVFEATSGPRSPFHPGKGEDRPSHHRLRHAENIGWRTSHVGVERWPGIKVLVATGYAEMPDEHKGKFERLGKPFTKRDLKAAIDRMV